MVQTKSTKITRNVGEEIGMELGAQMISSYRAANPNNATAYYIGRNILEQILAQPGCIGIKFYNAYHENGEEALVYVGVNTDGNDMLTVTAINTEGKLDQTKGIVADRSIKWPSVTQEENWWEF